MIIQLRETTEGLCEMCRERPAEYLGLVCSRCKDAIDRQEGWALANEDVLFRLRELEEDEDQYR